jgi:hypothetical protein
MNAFNNARTPAANGSRARRERPFQRAAQRFQQALAALAAGAGAVPFGDNGKLFRDLAELRRRSLAASSKPD